MKLRRVIAVIVGASTALAAGVVACGGDDDNTFSDYDGGSGTTDSGDTRPIGVGDGGATGPTSGVILVHAAAFPAFRLCFENYKDLPPQPDAKTLPQSNVVGVEMGSVVRIPAMARPPGKVYVIDQRVVSATPKDPAERSCRDVLANSTFAIGKQYEVVGDLKEPLGTNETAILALAGCGRKLWLNDVGAAASDCGDYDPSSGNLRLMTLALPSTRQTTATTLPVEVLGFSPALRQLAPPGQVVDITFGNLLDAGAGLPLTQRLATSSGLYDAGATTVLEVPLGLESTYGTYGFRVAYRAATDGGVTDAGKSDAEAGADAAAVMPAVLDQTLAEVQALSRPESNPTTYFLTASNYALLVIGDPRIRKVLDDGGANPTFDARRSLHILAIPVRDEADAGTLGGLGPLTQ